MDNLRIIFMGTPEFGVPTLQTLLGSQHQVVAVYSQPPRPAGRGHQVQKSPVHLLAEKHNIPVFTPKSLRDTEAQATFSRFNTDVAVVVAYGLILPNEILEAPKYGCINIHASLLPRWRGAAPIQRAILAGDTATGITTMQIAEELDSGAMLTQQSIPIDTETTAAQLHDNLSLLAAKMIIEDMEGLITGKIIPTPQPKDGITYAKKLTKEESKIDWQQPAQQIERQTRALNPWPGVWFQWQNLRIKLLKAIVISQKTALPPGTIINNELTVSCGQGALQLLEVQPQGKKPMDYKAFLNGYKIQNGKHFT